MIKKIQEIDNYLDTLTPFFLLLLATTLLYLPKFTQPLVDEEMFFLVKLPISAITLRTLLLILVLILESCIFIISKKLTKSLFVSYLLVGLCVSLVVAQLASHQSIRQYYENWFSFAAGKISKDDYYSSFNGKLLYNK